MPTDKDTLREKFSSDPRRYYQVSLFDEVGFVRKKCPICERHFWTLDQNRQVCPEQPCQSYTFIGNPPTPERYDYFTSWRKIENFFVKNGHTALSRYPVVCRWRPDLYFTIASIVDFQRIESGKVVFELPANPLIVPQMCLRFLDIANVGVTGRHYTSFCMIGQVALSNDQGYWKDRCIELDFNLLTKEFGIPREEIVFKEDVWLGPGAFGSSLEYHVRGLELGNAVFTAFEGTPSSYKEYSNRVIDMGAGLERFAWISQGTANSYDSVFPEVISKIGEQTGTSFENDEKMDRYYELAGSLDIDQGDGGNRTYQAIARDLGMEVDNLKQRIVRAQALYSIADHVRTLVFAIADGALPSNVGGGYNLRVILRRSLDFIEQLGGGVSLSEVASYHIKNLKGLFPELGEHLDDVTTVLAVEQQKYVASKSRASKIVQSFVAKETHIGSEKLEQLYDSEGITPESLLAAGASVDVPPDFYNKITQRHMADRHEETPSAMIEVSGQQPTKLLFYLNRDQFEFKAKVLKVLDQKYVILDATAFYARSGGQEPDHGTINGLFVSDVVKTNDVVIHRTEGLESRSFEEGDTVECFVDGHRRSLIMRHHTATHILNGACRKLIGPWVWQHSAFKDVDMGRLDITHFEHLSRERVLEIERLANEVVRKNLPIIIKWIPRNLAEKTYGFRLYQGGVVPVSELRIVNIVDWDVEACGGTHCSNTGDVGLIKITKAERIQDGVERLEFVAGEAAVNHVEKLETILIDSAAKLKTPTDKLDSSIANLLEQTEGAKKAAKNLARKLADLAVAIVPNESKDIGQGIKLYISPPTEEGLDSQYHVTVGEKLTLTEPDLVYVALFNEGGKTKIIAFSGEQARKKGVSAGALVRELAKGIGGSGGGDQRFGQGGASSSLAEIPKIESVIQSLMKK